MPETLETIAARITELGESIEAHFDRVGARFANIDGQLANVDGQLANVDARLANVDVRLANVDVRFANVDARFANVDQQFAGMKAHLEMKIEAVHADVHLVYDAVIAQTEHNEANMRAHTTFTERLEKHEVRILALESGSRSVKEKQKPSDC